MPTYEYLCRTCSHRFETRQKMTDEPLTVCPECGGTIRRVLFPAGVVFKGSGFYKTDHANGSGAGENGHAPKSDGAEPAKVGETGVASEKKSADSSSSNSSDADSSSTKSSESKVAAETK
ncbi:MAG TPA: FmdB family zinc ribbon protein [Ktedonobacteraceae bacterium]|nr:FmdB family zinc ribbon protein [Ktedonobacteraceae bacterium]